MITDMISNKRRRPIVTEQFIRGRKLNIATVFIIKSYFQVPKDVRLNFVLWIIHNRSLLVDFGDFMNLYKKCTAKPYSQNH